MRLLKLIFFLVISSFSSYAQLTFTNNPTATALAQNIVGFGMTVTNASLTCPTGASAIFGNGASTTLGITNGILLTTGQASDAGDAGSFLGIPFDADNDNGTDGDALMDGLAGTTTFDLCKLEFDVSAQCNNLLIKYKFGSEEYLEYVGSINDAFGFFITGPNPAGGSYNNQNIALVPGTSLPVSIDNINDVTNSSLFVDNGSGTSTVEYDGITTLLTASTNVVPCANYHVVLAIADAADGALDSGVFLQFGGFSCPSPTITTNVAASLCTANTGSASVTVAGLTPASYSWSPGGQTTSSITNQAPGTYTCSITFTNGVCAPVIQTRTVTITSPGVSPTVAVSSNTPCTGATLSFTTNSNGNSFSWSGPNSFSSTSQNPTIPSASSLSAGQYTLVVTNTVTGCIKTTYLTTTVSPSPTITATSGFICGGGSTTLTASGGTSYTWAPATGLSATSGSVVTANPGSTTEYTVTGLNSGCSGTVTTTVSVGGNPTVSVTSGSVCAGTSLTLTASGAANYTWSPAAGLSSTTGSVVVANPTTTTVYSVLGASGTCTNTSSGTVTVVPLPTLSATNGSVCGGSSATLTVSGATDYTWSPASDLSATNGSVVTASPSVTTVYTITGSAFGCSSVTTSTVSVLSNPTVSVNGATVCAGSTVNISASGATNYTWSASPSLSQTTGSLVTCSPSSTETFTVIGANGSCTNSAVGTVTVINLPVLSSASSSICSGNTGSLSVSGATTYTWLPSASLSPATGETVSANPSVTTVYTITGTMAGCSNTTTATMSVVPLPTVSITNASVCVSNPSVTLSASGATNYSWTPAASLSSSVGVSVVSNATTTTNYTVSGEAAGCTNTAVVTVSVIPNPTLSISNATICSGTNATLTASGASSYTWSPNVSLSSTSGSVVVASPGSTQTYSIVGESLGCTGTTTLSVDVIPSPSLTVNSASICSGESATLTATGAANYTWSPSTNLSVNSGSVVVASSPTTETFTLSGSNGICISTVTTQVLVTITPTVSLLGQDICSGTSSATLTASGAQNYTWSPSSSLSLASGSIVVANPSTTTEYSVVGANGICTNTAVVTVSVLPSPTLSVVGNTICSGSSGTLSVSGASNYTWSPAASLSSPSGSLVTANPITTTTYNIIGSLGSCLSSTTVAMVVNQTPTLSAVSQSICSGQSVQLQVTGASNYTWSPSPSLSSTTGSNVSANPLVTESYTVVGETAGCSGSVVSTVSVTTTPTISVTSGSICSGQSVQLTASGATNYTWTPSGSLSASTTSVVQASPNTNTTYSIVGANGVCANSATTSVVVTPTPTLNLNSGSICIGNSFTLTASGASDYTWSPGTNLSSTSGSVVAANPNTSTDYTAVGANGTCTVQSVTTLTVKPNVQLIASPDQTICAGQSTLIYANGGITYTWSPAITIIKNKDSIVTVMPPLTTIYTVTANKPGYCAQTTTISVLVNPLPIIDAGRDTTINIDETTLIHGTGDVTVGFIYPDNYDLNCNFCSSITVNPQENTCFVLTGVNDYGCRSYDTVCVYVTKDWNVYIPNTFTPNGDTKNDVFYVQGYGLKEIKLRVFNRWGQQIFESDSTNPGWDGKFNGVACEQGVYVYSVEAVSMGGQNYRKVGHVNLISNIK